MRRLLLPSVLLVAAHALDRGWLGMPELAAESLSDLALLQISRVLFVVAFLIAWRFRSGRAATAVALLAAVAEGFQLQPPRGGEWLPAIAVATALALALLAVLGEWRVASLAGLFRLGGVGALAAAVMAYGNSPAVTEILQKSLVGRFDAWRLAEPVLAVFALALLIVGLRFGFRRGPTEVGLLATLVAAFTAFELAERPLILLAGAGVILAVSQIERAFTFAFEDGLTGLPARRALEQHLRQLGRRYAIGMIDIDHFKRLNDRHGHDVGDQVLRLVGSRLNRVGGGGTAFRYGGEEFAVLFPGKSAKDAAPHLEDLRSAIADHPFAVRGPARPKRKTKGKNRRGQGGRGKSLKVTVSLGVADRNARRPGPEQVMKAADRALYRSKKAGRNRLTVA